MGQWLGVLLALGAVVLAVAYWMGRTAIVVLNETGRELRVLSVELRGARCDFVNVPPRAWVRCLEVVRNRG